MTDYTKLTDFASKDFLTPGDAAKILKGVELDDEFEAIGTAIETKADLASPILSGTPTLTESPGIATNNTRIATTAFVHNLVDTTLPTGVIVMWSGSVGSVPTGWALCDGTNDTPDLRNRFVVGAGDSYAVDATGGSADAILVSHTHTATDSGHVHTQGLNNAGAGSGATYEGANPGTLINSNLGYANISVSTEGEDGTNKNLPPYYALAYIMKTA